MVKFTSRKAGPNDPIFKGGLQIFKPASRPSTKSASPSPLNPPPALPGVDPLIESLDAEMSQSVPHQFSQTGQSSSPTGPVGQGSTASIRPDTAPASPGQKPSGSLPTPSIGSTEPTTE